MDHKLDEYRVEAIISGYDRNPHEILGMHIAQDAVIRAYIPNAESILVINEKDGTCASMDKRDPRGFFSVVFNGVTSPFPYKYSITDSTGHRYEAYDPYSFWPTISEYDLYLFNQGNHHRIYEKLGAHIREINGIPGVSFCVWAPHAKRVSVVGEFNQWDGRRHQMRIMGSSGVWELFIPGLVKRDLYKYEIRTPSDEIYLKADPYAFYAEKPPQTASRVYDLDNYTWQDHDWMAQRGRENTASKHEYL